ncbi:MAG: Ig domain-containing protein [Phycisphaerae bacterium]
MTTQVAQSTRLCRDVVVALSVIVLTASSPSPQAAMAAEFALVPVSATGASYTIDGNEITLSGGGGTVTLEIRLSDWAPNLLRNYQATIDSSGYTSGTQGSLTPDPDQAVVDTEHPDYVFAGVVNLPAVDTATLNYRYAATVLYSSDAVSDPGVDKYGGTLVLDVSADARGMFTVGFLSGLGQTSMVDENSQPITPLDLTAALVTIEVGRCCYGIGSRDAGCIDDITEDECYELYPDAVFDPGLTCADPCPECLSDEHCDDGVLCTEDICDLELGVCNNIPNDYLCNDGNECTDDICDPMMDCVNPPSPEGTVCDDFEECTYNDICDGLDPPSCVGWYVNEVVCGTPEDCESATGVAWDCVEGFCVCEPAPTAACCEGSICSVTTELGCEAVLGDWLGGLDPPVSDCTSDPCATGSCCLGPGECEDETVGGQPMTKTDCDVLEGEYHGGVTCGDGPCSDCLTHEDCDDGVLCTEDYCDPESDMTCINIPNDALCDDGDACTDDVCDPLAGDPETGCLNPPSPAGTQCLDEGIGCTRDVCDGDGYCDHIPDDSLCDDGQFCNGVEMCDPINDCQPGELPDCNDPVDCTVDTCDEVDDVCVHTPDDSLCDDGDMCTDEWCDPEIGCVIVPAPAGTPCDDYDECTIFDECDGADPPVCIGLDVNAMPCIDPADCDFGTGIQYECGIDGYCICERCVVSEPPVLDPNVPDTGNGTRNRYLSFSAGTPGRNVALRVKFVSLPSPHNYANGRTMWVKAPFPVSEKAGTTGSSPPDFWAAELGCVEDAHWADWTEYGVVHVYDVLGNVIPNGTYEIQAIDSTCPIYSRSSYSEPLVINTSKWGDVVGEFYLDPEDCRTTPNGYTDCWSPPNGVVNFDDISSGVDKFRNLIGAPQKSRADIAGDPPLGIVDNICNFVDISYCVDAFRGLPYPFYGPPETDPCDGEMAEDVFCSAAGITVEIFPGVLGDYPQGFEDTLILSSEGLGDAVVVRTDAPFDDCYEHGECIYGDCPQIETEITNLELAGFSARLGNVVVRERSDVVSDGAICCVKANPDTGDFISGDSYFNVYVEIDVPAHDVTLRTGDEPVRLQAEHITSLPPFNDDYIPQPPTSGVCEQPGGPHTIPLYLTGSPYQVGWLTHAMHHVGCPPEYEPLGVIEIEEDLSSPLRTTAAAARNFTFSTGWHYIPGIDRIELLINGVLFDSLACGGAQGCGWGGTVTLNEIDKLTSKMVGVDAAVDEVSTRPIRKNADPATWVDVLCTGGNVTLQCGEPTQSREWKVLKGTEKVEPDGPSASITFTITGTKASDAIKDVRIRHKAKDADGDVGRSLWNLTVVEIKDIDVKNDTATTIDDGPSTPAKTDVAAAIKGSGDVLVEAELNPNVSAADLPANFITWTGGQAVADNQLQRKASKSAWAKHTLQATCGTSKYTMLVYIIGAEKGGYSPANGTSGTHFADNSKGYSSTGLLGPNAGTGRAKSQCEIEFSVKPDALITDGNNGLFKKSHIQWDVSRDKRVMKWKKTGGTWSLVDDRSASWASDDNWHTEEDNNPWNGNGHLYGNDAPENIPGGVQAYVKKLNMREWVRVGLGGTTGPNGTRCSEYYPWHAFRSLKKNPPWVNDNTYGNEVPTGNIFWGTVPTTGITITTASLPNGKVGQAYSQTLTSTGGTAPITWSLDTGSLPPGLNLNATTGAITGTPTQAGTFAFTMEAQDSSAPPQADLQTLSIKIVP